MTNSYWCGIKFKVLFVFLRCKFLEEHIFMSFPLQTNREGGYWFKYKRNGLFISKIKYKQLNIKDKHSKRKLLPFLFFRETYECCFIKKRKLNSSTYFKIGTSTNPSFAPRSRSIFVAIAHQSFSIRKNISFYENADWSKTRCIIRAQYWMMGEMWV